MVSPAARHTACISGQRIRRNHKHLRDLILKRHLGHKLRRLLLHRIGLYFRLRLLRYFLRRRDILSRQLGSVGTFILSASLWQQASHKKYSSRDQHEQDQHDYHTHNDRTFRIFLSSLTSLFLIHMLPLSRCSLFLWSDYSKSFPEPKELFFP